MQNQQTIHVPAFKRGDCFVTTQAVKNPKPDRRSSDSLCQETIASGLEFVVAYDATSHDGLVVLRIVGTFEEIRFREGAATEQPRLFAMLRANAFQPMTDEGRAWAIRMSLEYGGGASSHTWSEMNRLTAIGRHCSPVVRKAVEAAFVLQAANADAEHDAAAAALRTE